MSSVLQSTLPNIIRTTYQNDFIFHKFNETKSNQEIEYDPLKNLSKPQKPQQFDLETLSKLRKTVYVPFNLLFRTKEVVRTNPHQHIENVKIEEEIFEEKLIVRKTRPRVFLEPQICLDNIPEEIMYGENKLVDKIYSSDWKDTSKFCIDNSPLTKSGTSSNDGPNSNLDRNVLLEKSLESIRFKAGNNIPSMDVGLKKYAKDWDRFQSKEFVDKDKLFWKGTDLGKCSLCDPPEYNKSLTDEETKEIQECLEEDSLRFAYTFFNSNYTGYRPKVPVGISYKRKLFNKSDPYVTTAMEAEGVYKK